MPLFKFKRGSKKAPMKSSSMGNLYKDYGDNREGVTTIDKRSSWENVVDHNTAAKDSLAELHTKIEQQAAQLEELNRKLEKQDASLREHQLEKNLLLLKQEVLIDMVAYKTAENQSLANNNAKLKAYVDKKLQRLKRDVA